MKKTHFLNALFALFFAALFSQMVSATPIMENKHSEQGLACSVCHEVDQPTSAPKRPDGKCLSCHTGSYDQLAQLTTESDPNPHYTHLGEMPCTECHQEHAPSVNMCNSCHNITMDVP